MTAPRRPRKVLRALTCGYLSTRSPASTSLSTSASAAACAETATGAVVCLGGLVSFCGGVVFGFLVGVTFGFFGGASVGAAEEVDGLGEGEAERSESRLVEEPSPRPSA